MALVRWDPFSELNTLHEQVNSLFNTTFSNAGSSQAPATDVYSTDTHVTIETHLPHFKQEEISVQQHDGELEIQAEHKEKEEQKNRTYLVRESVNRYYRRFTLPKNSDADHIKAEYQNGVLTVTVPYKELPKPRHIAIGTSNKAKA